MLGQQNAQRPYREASDTSAPQLRARCADSRARRHAQVANCARVFRFFALTDLGQNHGRVQRFHGAALGQ